MKKLFSGILIIPLAITNNWHIESYSKITANNVVFENQHLLIKINHSASPLIYSFDQAKKISGFEISGEFQGLPEFKDSALQGKKGFDDYPLRIGFILKGDNKLSFLQKLVSPEWVKKLYSSIPKATGIDHVEFYNVTQNSSQFNTSRVHPASKLLKENFFSLVKNAGVFTYKVNFNSSYDVVGIWLSSDGDDTLSKYEVIIDKLKLEETP